VRFGNILQQAASRQQVSKTQQHWQHTHTALKIIRFGCHHHNHFLSQKLSFFDMGAQNSDYCSLSYTQHVWSRTGQGFPIANETSYTQMKQLYKHCRVDESLPRFFPDYVAAHPAWPCDYSKKCRLPLSDGHGRTPVVCFTRPSPFPSTPPCVGCLLAKFL
jgi:hypothetical protein